MIRRTWTIVLSVVWAVLAAVWALFLTMDKDSPLSCQLQPGDSVFGDPSWSWIDLGNYCTYKVGGDVGTITTAPGSGPLAVTILLIAWGVSMGILSWAGRRDMRSAAK